MNLFQTAPRWQKKEIAHGDFVWNRFTYSYTLIRIPARKVKVIMNFSRIFSLLIYLVYAGFAIREREVVIALFPLIGMAFIWFPSLAKFFDQLGVGISRRAAPMDPNTPSCVFVMIGWALLLSPALIGLVAKLASM